MPKTEEHEPIEKPEISIKDDMTFPAEGKEVSCFIVAVRYTDGEDIIRAQANGMFTKWLIQELIAMDTKHSLEAILKALEDKEGLN